MTYIPKLLAEYIQYQYINSTVIYSPIVGSMYSIQLLEYPIPTAAAVSHKLSSADISETESGIRDPLVSKRPERKFWIKKIKIKEEEEEEKIYI